MLRRLLVGLLEGLVIGGLMALLVVKGLSMTSFAATAGGATLAYVFAALTGAITGLVAGKPIWASGAQIEAGLKAIVGALLAAGGMFALRKWATPEVDLSGIQAGAGSIGALPAMTLPILAAVLGGLFELDNTGSTDEGKSGTKALPGGAAANGERAPAGKKRIAAETQPHEDEEADAVSRKARR